MLLRSSTNPPATPPLPPPLITLLDYQLQESSCIYSWLLVCSTPYTWHHTPHTHGTIHPHTHGTIHPIHTIHMAPYTPTHGTIHPIHMAPYTWHFGFRETIYMCRRGCSLTHSARTPPARANKKTQTWKERRKRKKKEKKFRIVNSFLVMFV